MCVYLCVGAHTYVHICYTHIQKYRYKLDGRRWEKALWFFMQTMEKLISPLEQSALLFWGKPSEHNHRLNVEQVFNPHYSLFFGKDGKELNLNVGVFEKWFSILFCTSVPEGCDIFS